MSRPYGSIADPIEKTRIVAEFIAEREAAVRERRLRKWTVFAAWLPLITGGGFYAAMELYFHNGSKEAPPYWFALVYPIYLLFRLEQRSERIERKLDALIKLVPERLDTDE